MRVLLRSYAARTGVYFGIQRIICYLIGYLLSQCRQDELYRCPRSCPGTKMPLDSFGMATYMGIKGAVFAIDQEQ